MPARWQQDLHEIRKVRGSFISHKGTGGTEKIELFTDEDFEGQIANFFLGGADAI